MRVRSLEADKFAQVTSNPMGRGTGIPFFFETFIEGERTPEQMTQMDAVAALMLRYRVLEVQWSGSFSYSGSMTDDGGDEWSASASGSWAYSRKVTTTAQREGDYLKNPSFIADSLKGTFSGSATAENSTTGDTFSTAFTNPTPPHWRLFFEFGADAELTRGLKLVRTFQGQHIGVELSALAIMSGLQVFSEGPGGGLSTLVDYSWFTNNEVGAGSPTGTCAVEVNLITGDSIDLEVFTTSKANPPVVIGSPKGGKVAGSASSQASMRIVGSEPWPYGVNPAEPLDYTTSNRLWDDQGNATTSLERVVRAPMTTA